MNAKKCFATALVAISSTLLSVSKVNAHAPAAVLPVHHATKLAVLSAHKIAPTLFTVHHTTAATLVHSQLNSMLGLSGSAKAQALFNNRLFSQGVNLGVSNFPGGYLSGATFTGSGFVNFVNGGSSSYFAVGPTSVSLGNITQANGSNIVTFVPNVIRGVPLVKTNLPISGALRAALQRNNNLLFGGVAAGQRSFGGTVTGGLFAGTAYLPDFPTPGSYESIANGLIAFGKDPLNQSFTFGMPVNGILSGGYFKFANGITEHITNGSLLFNNVSPNLLPNFAPTPVIYLAVGSNPFNTTNQFSVINSGLLSSFLFFK